MLCHVCEATFSKLVDLIANDTGDPFDSDYKLDHHSSHASLASSATDDCYICSQINERITEKGLPTDSQSPFPLTIWYADRSKDQWPKVIRVELNHRDIPNDLRYPLVHSHVGGFYFRRVVPHDLLDSKEAKHMPTAFSDKTSSAETISQIMDWQELCTKTHDLCKEGREETWMPSRLLEISDVSGTLRVHLRDRSQLQCSRYLTLSHCWGPSGTQTVQLTTESLGNLQKGIDVASLKPTFCDMATLAWRLGASLIWIDCMCIIQDDYQDWQKEAGSMGRVYANSWLNVSANAAGDGHSGLFVDRNGSRLKVYFDTRSDHNDGTTKWEIFPLDGWSGQVESTPVNQRAWVLQERILSPRIVHMSKTLALWECKELQASEIFPSGNLPHESSHNYGQLKRMYHGSRFEDQSNIQFDWKRLLDKYTPCGLTFETDKLIALSGIASKVSKRAQCDYLAGLWSNDLPLGLLWLLPGSPKHPRSEAYVAPSWSWASVKGRIWPYDARHPPGDVCATFIGHKISPANPADMFGQVTSGMIEIRAPLGTLDWTIERFQYERDLVVVYLRVTGESGSIETIAGPTSPRCGWGPLHFDCLGYDGFHTAYFAAIRSQPPPNFLDARSSGRHWCSKYLIEGLILSRLPCSRYTRIGIAQIHIETKQEVEDAIYKMPQQEITIV